MKRIIIMLAVIGMFLNTAYAGSASLSYTIRESIPVSSDVFVAAEDMDGDNILDIVLWNKDGNKISVLERNGNSFVSRYEITAAPLRIVACADIDGDGFPEIISGDYKNVNIWEASENDEYSLKHTEYIGSFIDHVRVGDHDGDGRKEFLIGRESFPSQLIVLGVAADDTYVIQNVFEGNGGNITVTGTFDSDGDGAVETVFNDDNYDFPHFGVYVFEGGYQRYSDSFIRGISLGDTDGNGLGEIVGIDYTTKNLVILESSESDNTFASVFDGPSDYSSRVVDIDNDGRKEFFRYVENDSGHKNIFILARRTGQAFTEIYDSGSLLQGFSGDIRGFSVIKDTNGDGNREIAISQGGQLHILESAAVSGSQLNDTLAPAGSVHAYDNAIWPANNKMVEVTLDGYVRDELSIARDGGGIGVSSAYLLINGSETIMLRDGTTDLLGADGTFSSAIEVKAVKGAEYSVELYAADTNPAESGGPNSGLVDSTYIRVPHDAGEK